MHIHKHDVSFNAEDIVDDFAASGNRRKNFFLAIRIDFNKYRWRKAIFWARSIQPKFRPVRPEKEDHLKRWTSFFETFPVGPNRSIEFSTEISGNFG